MKAATETPEQFSQRINKLEREAAAIDADMSLSDADAPRWFLGSQLRSRGSIHSDVWMGTAIELAEKSHIAVFPVGGWWKDWKEARKYETSVRYALVISLEAPESMDIDLYRPIVTQLKVPVEITTSS